MNVRKSADYSAMYREFTEILTQNLPQMDEIHAIGKIVSCRSEKGAAARPQSSCRRISLTAQAFLHATCAGCAIFTGLTKMTNHSSGWQ